jgi:GNAT superfamily N-acetyltransferase
MSNPRSLTLQPIGASDADRLSTFFAEIANDGPTVQFFHPHPMTREQASALCVSGAARRDRYSIATHLTGVVAYSMLRGWDEGYDVPSFGGCVGPAFRGVGLGRWILVKAMHESRMLGAQRLRLTVYKANTAAVGLYRELGFVMSDKNENEFVGFADLTVTLPTCDESVIAQKVSSRAERLRKDCALAGH